MVLPEVLVLVADGSEEMETVITVDVLRRAGVRVSSFSVSSFPPCHFSGSAPFQIAAQSGASERVAFFGGHLQQRSEACGRCVVASH